LKPSKPFDQRRVIELKGTRAWKEVSWDGTGHRTLVLIEVGICLRFAYPAMVTEGGQEIAAHYWLIGTSSRMGTTGHTQAKCGICFGKSLVIFKLNSDFAFVSLR
jgi:hypothetical protein